MIGEKGYRITFAVIFPSLFIFIKAIPNNAVKKNSVKMIIFVRMSKVPVITNTQLQIAAKINPK